MKKTIREYIDCAAGTFLFVFALNLIISPLGLYNGGFVGIGQLTRYVLVTYAGVDLRGVDIAGIVYFLLNVPMFVLAFKSMKKDFFFKTIFTILVQTVFMSLIPIPAKTFTNDKLTACIIGGVLGGIGTGIGLRAGASGGGLEILGVYFSQKASGFSVGKIIFLVNALIYGCCALLFDLETVAYSLIYTGVLSIVMDRVHLQNINAAAMVLTDRPGVDEYLSRELNREVTMWQGEDGKTKDGRNIALVALSTYAAETMRRKLKTFDPDALVIMNEGDPIYGRFEKRMES